MLSVPDVALLWLKAIIITLFQCISLTKNTFVLLMSRTADHHTAYEHVTVIFYNASAAYLLCSCVCTVTDASLQWFWCRSTAVSQCERWH